MKTGPALPDPRPTPDKDAALVRAMFDRVAPRYDLANTVFSLGQDRHWRRVAVRAADPRPGEWILDVGAGTGALAAGLRTAGARVVALDFSQPMLAAGARRDTAPRSLLWTAGDATRLPFGDGAFDAVTIAFALRNLPDAAAGLREMARVTRPGGRLVVCEFSTPSAPRWRKLYTRYLVGAIPSAARLLTSNPAAYRYLAESIRAWPAQRGLATVIASSGWTAVRWTNLTGGIVALHRAIRGGATAAPRAGLVTL
jgi:demethylmenaquinone methyltransferase / 2-methoxy-6-polyprenyl-1,4-benzoquinol methylase